MAVERNEIHSCSVKKHIHFLTRFFIRKLMIKAFYTFLHVSEVHIQQS